MAGGIFVDAPYHANAKCVVFGVVVAAVYWFLPKYRYEPNVYALPFLFAMSYISLAVYDYLYDCSWKLKSGTALGPNTLDAIFKPQERDQAVAGKHDLQDQEHAYQKNVYLFHLLAVSPLLIYVGIYGNDANPKAFAPVLLLGFMSLAYFSVRWFYPRDTRNNNNNSV